MRILFVNDGCGWFGGVEQNIADTVSGLKERGHQVFLAYRDQTSKRPEEFAALFAEAHRCSDLGLSGAGTPGLPFSRLIDQVKPDVVYLHKFSSIEFLEAHLGKLRTVRMVHDHDLCCPRRHKYFAATGRICHRRFDWGCLLDAAFIESAPDSFLRVRPVNLLARFREMRRNRRLDALLVGSRFMRDELLANGFPPERIHIVPPVIRMSAPAVPPALGDEELLFVGQLIRGKGVDLLLRALPLVRQSWRLTVIGEGNARPGLETLVAKLGLADRVRFLGWIPREELGAQYARARLSVVPSRWPEPFGMVGLEAMLYARPVVGFAVGGIPDWLEDGVTGLTAPEQDLAGLAAAIDRLLGDRALAMEFGRRGREAVLGKFTFSAYLDTLSALFLGLEKR